MIGCVHEIERLVGTIENVAEFSMNLSSNSILVVRRPWRREVITGPPDEIFEEMVDA